MDKLFLRVKDLQAMGLSRDNAYRLFRRDDAPIVTIGNVKYMLADKFAEWIAGVQERGEL